MPPRHSPAWKLADSADEPWLVDAVAVAKTLGSHPRQGLGEGAGEAGRPPQPRRFQRNSRRHSAPCWVTRLGAAARAGVIGLKGEACQGALVLPLLAAQML